jgi:hypothetical protein
MSSLVFSVMVTPRGVLRITAVDKGALKRYLDIIRTNCQKNRES